MQEKLTIRTLKSYPYINGILLTTIISFTADIFTNIPLLSIIGQMVLSIIIGLLWQSAVGVSENLMKGIAFTSKYLLRAGIVLLGSRLNLFDIYQSGISIFYLAFVIVLLTFLFVYAVARLLKTGHQLSILTACGTAICGAAAVAAIASQIKAKDDDTAIAAASVCLIGTVFTLMYTVFYSTFHLSDAQYGIFTGGTLHEVAHVIAAASIAGTKAANLAMVVKLTRVILLVPAAFFIGWMSKRQQTGGAVTQKCPFPWFILGFLLMSFLNTLHLIPDWATTEITNLSYFLIGMAMAAIGLSIRISAVQQKGLTPIISSLVGSTLLSVSILFIAKVFF